VRIAYLTAQYPKTSHSFIRREIAALEQLGVVVERYSVRRVDEPLVDPDDVAEQARTRALLESGALGMLAHAGLLALQRPRRWVGGLLSALRMGWRSDRGLMVHLIYLCEACTLVRLMQRQGVEHLHAHFATNATSVALLCSQLGGPGFSFTVHGIDVLDLSPVLSLDAKVRGARFVAAVSQHSRAHLMRYSSPEDWGKIHIIRCGLDSTFLDQPRVPPPAEPKLVCVARFDAEKGLLVLLEAAALVVREGVPLSLELIGDGPLRPDIERAVTRLHLEKNVVLRGRLSNAQVRDRLLASRALVLPSFSEGLPVVIMEAFATGRSVIATYIGGIPELVVPGENGWLVPASSVEGLARAMREALQLPPAELERMGARGRERVVAQHSAASEASRLVRLFAAQGVVVP